MQYSVHAGKGQVPNKKSQRFLIFDFSYKVDLNDIKLAVQAKINTQMTSTPQRNVKKKKKTIWNDFVSMFQQKSDFT